jgi:hypothetical protein
VGLRTDLYREQHRELQNLAAELAALLDHGNLVAHSDEAYQLVRRLAGKVTVHLDMEDRSLYPELLRGRGTSLRALAQRFQVGQREVRQKTQAFLGTWLRPGAVAADPSGFAEAARWLLHALSERMHAEDAELFPLADAEE